MVKSRLTRAGLAAPALALLLAAHGHGAPAQAPAAASLATIWTDGTLLQDHDGDGVIDFVDASFVMAEAPSAAEIAAAGDVAARLGHETLAMNLPLSSSRTGVVIAIGSGGVTRAGATVETTGLASGQGVVAMSEAGGRAVVAITGADDEGTRAAAQAFAGRLPFAGATKGARLADVLEDVRKALEGAGAPPASIASSRHGRTNIRIALRQMKSQGHASATLDAWLASFDQASSEEGDDDAVLHHRD